MTIELKTIEEAARYWVGQFNAIPYSVIEMLRSEENGDWDNVREITPIAIGDRVYVWDSNVAGDGEVIGRSEEDDEKVIIEMDEPISSNDEELDGKTTIEAYEDNCQKEAYGCLPMWGTMWTFDNSCDEWWAEHHLHEMADCGFRIYENDDLGIIFGIDGAGYDFYEAHWIPLYKARGLRWHDLDENGNPIDWSKVPYHFEDVEEE